MRAAILQSVLLFSVTAVLFAFRGVERAQQRQFAQGIARAAHGEKDLAQKCEDPRAVYDTRSAAQDFRKQIQLLEGNALGVVANLAPAPRGGYYY